MGLFRFRSCRQNVRFLPVLFSALFFVFLFLVSAVSAVSAVSMVPERSGASAVYGVGEEITLGGETNLAPGTIILITIEEVAFRSTEKGGSGAFSGTSGTVVVQEGTHPFWSFSFATDGWTPGEYLVTVEVPKTGTTESGTFSLFPAEEIPVTPVLSSPSPSPPDVPESSPTSPVASPMAIPLSPAVGVAGFAAVYLFRAYRS